MEENEYRDIYHKVNQCRCVFEKSILSRQTMCSHAHRFNLADREGVTCNEPALHPTCKQFLDTMRAKALFALKLTKIDGPLPHAKEVKVQTGSLLGLLAIVKQQTSINQVDDIISLLQQAEMQFGGLNAFPYDELTRRIVHYEGRQKRRRPAGKPAE